MPGSDMTEEQLNNMTSNDHDLLITVHEQVKQIRNDIRELNTNFASRLERVEINKLNQIEAQQKFTEYAMDLKEIDTRTRLLEEFCSNLKGKWAILAIIGSILIAVFTSALTTVVVKNLNLNSSCTNNCVSK